MKSDALTTAAFIMASVGEEYQKFKELREKAMQDFVSKCQGRAVFEKMLANGRNKTPDAIINEIVNSSAGEKVRAKCNLSLDDHRKLEEAEMNAYSELVIYWKRVHDLLVGKSKIESIENYLLNGYSREDFIAEFKDCTKSMQVVNTVAMLIKKKFLDPAVKSSKLREIMISEGIRMVPPEATLRKAFMNQNKRYTKRICTKYVY